MYCFFVFDYLLLATQAPVTRVKANEAPAVIQGEEKAAPEAVISYGDYAAVAENNLFHPERHIPRSEKVALPKPELILYGTLITDEMSIAYVEDKKAPYSTPGRAKRQTARKKGNSIAGYMLKEIERDRIVLVRGDDKLVVMLNNVTDKRMGGVAGSLLTTQGGTASFVPTPINPAVSGPAFAPPQAAPPRRPASLPTAPRGQTPDAIRNSIMHQRGMP